MSSELPPSSRLVAYLRDSGGRDQNLSVPQQQAAVVAWCQERGHILTRIFADVARSGTRTAGRDAFIEMVDYLENGAHEKGVIFWEYSRLSRDYDNFQYFVADLRRKGFAVISITDNVPEGLDGRLLESITAYRNAKYSEDLRKNIKRGQRYLIAVHKAKPGGTAPRGYRYRSVEIGKRRDGSIHMANKLEPDPRYAPLVKRAFEMRAAGATYNEIHDETRLFTWTVLYNKLLHNPIYMGTAIYGGVEYPDFCPPIVDKVTWDAVQKLNKDRAEQHGYNHPRAVRSRFFLSGLLACGVCGRPMNGRVSHQRKPYNTTYLYYRCQSENTGVPCGALVIRKEAMEGRVLTALKTMLESPDVLSDIYQQLQDDAEGLYTNYEAALGICRNNLQSVRGQIGRMVAAIRDAGHSPSMLTELSGLETQEQELITRLAQMEAQPPTATDVDIDALAADALTALDKATDPEKGVIIRGFVKRIVATRVGPRGKNGKITGEIECYAPGTESTFVVPL